MNLTTGNYNTIIGSNSASVITTGSNNISFGFKCFYFRKCGGTWVLDLRGSSILIILPRGPPLLQGGGGAA